ncbi:uncharacterized protein K444DRAFT_354471 [Hyaloscypha bicolor E]|uniref:ATPase synthesis protein 25 n=1 Tax=Hyaloscypha bicolor E TaxID=1095630 RepID=A0A2J6TIT9_9HELO|nr:uncharacterized protein K444DRAFT_354471 [Hyaloscypha bicolor E]PMD62937.1 hypothetical protein K444DRAFT_354471 [Hyaloscypha bicolor E]
MVVNRALRATGCAGCRLSLLRSFASLAGAPIRAPVTALRFPRCQPSSQTRQSSRFTSESEVWKDDIEDSKQTKIEPGEAEEELEYVEELSEEEPRVSTVPWYVQVNSPQRAPQPLSERQRIPELPETPPPILEPLLKQISIDLGLDDLSLLDLRKLDPPPALGANLLMLIGTARSEKHLHVSADRLCRWLRSTYKLRPNADGLLGRNELKLKLKRKAKKAKLLGSSTDENADDGVRTGWVCVDVGVVEEAEGGAIEPSKQDFVGFGRRTEGVRMVVQMLTEEKREEVDLESLWSGILRRGTQPHVEDAEDAEALSTGNASTPEALPESIRPAGTAGPSSFVGQTRGFHTSARRLLQEVEPAATAGSTASDFEVLDLDQLRKSAMQNIVSGDYLKVSNMLRQASQLVPRLQNGGWRLFLLDLLRTYLSSLPRDQALQELGNSDSQTPFITCFKDALSLYPTEFEAESRIWLHVYARGLEHPDYDKGNLFALMDELLLAGVRISRPAYIYALRSLILPGTRGHTSTKSLKAATRILEAMYDQGMDILTEDIFVELQEAAAASPAQATSPYQVYTHPDDTHDLPGMRMTPVQRRLHVLTKTIDLPPFSDESRMRLMHLHAKNQYWLEFWDIFRMAPRQGQPNSAAMYAFMFGTVAQTGHQKACMNVLRTWTTEMRREQPPVAFEGEVAEAIKACLRVADPYIEQAVVDSPDAKGEWLSLWQKCRWTGGQNDPFLYD